MNTERASNKKEAMRHKREGKIKIKIKRRSRRRGGRKVCGWQEGERSKDGGGRRRQDRRDSRRNGKKRERRCGQTRKGRGKGGEGGKMLGEVGGEGKKEEVVKRDKGRRGEEWEGTRESGSEEEVR